MFGHAPAAPPANDLMKALAEALGPYMGQKHTTPAGTPVGPYLHGPGGLFGVSGIEREVISTRLQPMGLASALPVKGSKLMHPLFGYITGFGQATGEVADGVCDDPQTAGPASSCLQTAPYGRYEFQTREAEINRIGQANDRGEFFDLALLNAPLAREMGGIFPNLPEQGRLLAGAEILARMLEVGVAFQNLLLRKLYTGTPANNSAGGGFKDFIGLDILIGVNKVDAITGSDCAELFSDIKDFNYGCVDNANLDPGIVEVITYLLRYVKHNASRGGFNPVKWVLAMRDDLFYELTAVWPCTYLTYRCIVSTTNGMQGTLDVGDAIAMRDAMRTGSYLVIDGQQIPVVIDDGIVEESSSDTNRLNQGCFASDIYLVPLTVGGGIPVTFWEYFDYRADVLPNVADGRMGGFYWTDDGRYLWHNKPPKNFCVQQIAKIEPRVILRTPQLAGRITNVCYCPLQHTRDTIPGDDYGPSQAVTTRAAPSLYDDYKASLS